MIVRASDIPCRHGRFLHGSFSAASELEAGMCSPSTDGSLSTWTKTKRTFYLYPLGLCPWSPLVIPLPLLGPFKSDPSLSVSKTLRTQTLIPTVPKPEGFLLPRSDWRIRSRFGRGIGLMLRLHPGAQSLCVLVTSASATPSSISSSWSVVAGNFGAKKTFSGEDKFRNSAWRFKFYSTRRAPLVPATSDSPPPSAGSGKRMGGDAENGGVEVAEGPVPKLQKVLHVESRGASEDVPLLRVKRLSENAVLPSRGSPYSAGYDLSSAVDTKVPGRGKALVPTDLSISIPQGTYARIAPRSGLAWKHSIDVGAGVVDVDYRGPIGVILFNHSDVAFEVKTGDRVAQLIIERIMTPEVVEVESLDSTVRGAGGFGSTGL